MSDAATLEASIEAVGCSPSYGINLLDGSTHVASPTNGKARIYRASSLLLSYFSSSQLLRFCVTLQR